MKKNINGPKSLKTSARDDDDDDDDMPELMSNSDSSSDDDAKPKKKAPPAPTKAVKKSNSNPPAPPGPPIVKKKVDNPTHSIKFVDCDNKEIQTLFVKPGNTMRTYMDIICQSPKCSKIKGGVQFFLKGDHPPSLINGTESAISFNGREIVVWETLTTIHFVPPIEIDKIKSNKQIVCDSFTSLRHSFIDICSEWKLPFDSIHFYLNMDDKQTVQDSSTPHQLNLRSYGKIFAR